MKELDEVYDAFCKGYDIDKWTLINGRSGRFARQHLCYTVTEYYPHMLAMLEKPLGLSSDVISNNAIKIKDMVESDLTIKGIDRKIRRRLKIKSNSHRKARRCDISTTRRMFGFDYTEQEDLDYFNAIQDSTHFWSGFSKVGRKPIQNGDVFRK